MHMQYRVRAVNVVEVECIVITDVEIVRYRVGPLTGRGVAGVECVIMLSRCGPR